MSKCPQAFRKNVSRQVFDTPTYIKEEVIDQSGCAGGNHDYNRKGSNGMTTNIYSNITIRVQVCFLGYDIISNENTINEDKVTKYVIEQRISTNCISGLGSQ